jgi:hypothetical protein
MRVVYLKTDNKVKKIEDKVISMFRRKAFCLRTFNQLQFTGFIA